MSTQFKYQYDSSVKFDCPSCKAKKRFVRYRDMTEPDPTKCWVEFPYGYCDRIESCGHNVQIDETSDIQNKIISDPTLIKYFNLKPPETVVAEQWIDLDFYRDIKFNEHLIENLEEKYQKPVIEGAYNDILKVSDDTFSYKNTFLIGLVELFGRKEVKRVYKEYKLMTFIDGGIVYPYFDYYDKLINGKIMFYDKNTLKRIKTGHKSRINWLHNCSYRGEIQNKVIRLDDYPYSLSFFGFNSRIDNYRDIGLVEAEKTAVILSIIFPEIKWLATGSVQNIQKYKFFGLNFKNIILMPDMGFHMQKDISIRDYWYYKIKYYTDYHIVNSTCQNIDYVPSWFSIEETENAKKSGNDPADYILEYKRNDPEKYEKYIEELREKLKKALEYE